MNQKREVFNSGKRQHLDYYNILSNWCTKNGLFVATNNEVFSVDTHILMKPEFVINGFVYVDVIDPKKITQKYLEYCRLFSFSYGTIIIIPKDMMVSMDSVTKKDICEKFNIHF